MIILRALVQVYPAEGPCSKPDMGEGLNKPAEISLYKIFRRDAKGETIKEGDVLCKFVNKLKATASKQSTEFVDYDAEKGIWRFRVEHFSRCSSNGLVAVHVCCIYHVLTENFVA